MLSCLGDSAIPVKDRMDDPRLCLDEGYHDVWSTLEVDQGWSCQRQFERGRAEDWLAASAPGYDFDPNAIRCTYVASLSAHRGRAAARCMCFCSSRGFRHLYDFLPALVGAGSGNRNLRRQISARSTLPEC
jgi:hypothetical protein